MYQVLLYYHFTTLLDPEAFLKKHLKYCKANNILGRIIVSKEGINGTVCALKTETESYMSHLKSLDCFDSMEFKIDPSDTQIFKRISIKLKNELVTLGLDNDINPLELTGKHLEPTSYLKMMKQPDVVILDARNTYEYDLGHFRGAIRPDIKTFKELPKWIQNNRQQFEGKRVLTYCTGGVRCEKFSGLLLHEGIKDVYQLKGGIVTYGKDPIVLGARWDGLCYVFDPRIAVEINQIDPVVIGKDYFTHEPCDRYINCANPFCNKKILCTRENEVKYRGSCCDACRIHPKNVFETRPRR